MLYSRELLFPGPLPPLSHLGVTLLRHSIATGLRYALYQLGLEPPERPPVAVVRLRPYMDGKRLRRMLSASAAEREVAEALLDPGGVGEPGQGLSRLRGAAGWHRARLRLSRRGPARPRPVAGGSSDPTELWQRFQAHLRRRQTLLNDALLAELLAALERRSERARGRAVPPCRSPEACRLVGGRKTRLHRLGSPDLRQRSWAGDGGAHRRLPPASTSPGEGAHPFRGRFRECWRQLLDELRPVYLSLAERAVERGLLERPDDAFFLPFDLAGDLAGERPLEWLPSAVAANRRELEAQRELEAPPALLTAQPPPARLLREIPEVDESVLTPLP